MKKIMRISIFRGVVTVISLCLLVAMLTSVSWAKDGTLTIGFEDGTTMGFAARGNGALTVVSDVSHTGQYSLLITGRTHTWNGPSINVAPHIVPGTVYYISIWVLAKTPGSSQFILSTQIGDGAQARFNRLVQRNISVNDGWVELRAQHTFGSENFITIYVENLTANAEFHIDDFVFSDTPPDGSAPQNPLPGPITGNRRGTFDGFDYEFWSETGSGGSMQLTGGGTFTCTWDGRNILSRTGKRLGSVSSYHAYGDIIIEYAATHNITRGNVSYLTAYGWTEGPLMEYYVVENYGNYKPPGGVGFRGRIVVDGGIYEVYVDTRVNQPSIQGTQTFPQIFSVRVDRRTSGTITLSDHFKAWERLGLDVSGNLYEVALCVEGFNSGGNANVYKHILTIGGEVFGADIKNPLFNRFIDVPNDNWQNTAVLWADINKITTGSPAGSDTFKPDNPITRAEFVTFLHRIYGSPSVTETAFSDMPGNEAFQNAILWARAKGITTGSPANSDTFLPNRPISREELAVMLHRYIDGGTPAPANVLGNYIDQNAISTWAGAGAAVNWAVYNGIMGQNINTLNPGGNATRAEAVTMLYRVVEAFNISAP